MLIGYAQAEVEQASKSPATQFARREEEEDGDLHHIATDKNDMSDFSVYGLRIAPTHVRGVQLFRPWGWEIALIVSESIKEAMQRLGATGARFAEV